jgi:hypothetical protein
VISPCSEMNGIKREEKKNERNHGVRSFLFWESRAEIPVELIFS